MHSSNSSRPTSAGVRGPGTLERAQHHPDGGIAVSLASGLDLHYLHRAGRFSPDDVRRIWAVTEDPSSTTSAVPITAPAVAHFDSAELAALRDPGDRLINSAAIDHGAPLGTKDRAIAAVAETGAVEVIWGPDCPGSKGRSTHPGEAA